MEHIGTNIYSQLNGKGIKNMSVKMNKTGATQAELFAHTLGGWSKMKLYSFDALRQMNMYN